MAANTLEPAGVPACRKWSSCHCTPLYGLTVRSDANDPDAVHWCRRVTDLLDQGATNPGEAERRLLMSEGELANFPDAEPHAAWRAMVMDEMAPIESNRTWSLSDLPAGQRPIGLKWVFKEKKNTVGEMIKHKARLVAKGCVQRADIDFKVFAPVARLDSVRVLLAVAA